MLITEALKTHVTSVSAISALIKKRFYAVKAPDIVEKPYTVYQRISVPREEAMGGEAGLAHTRIQVTHYGTTYAQVAAVADAFHTEFKDYRNQTMGGVSGVVVQAVTIDDEEDDYDSDTELFWVRQDLIIDHEE